MAYTHYSNIYKKHLALGVVSEGLGRRLFDLVQIDDGNRLPDAVSRPYGDEGRFLAFEFKSSDGKGELNLEQSAYGFATCGDYDVHLSNSTVLPAQSRIPLYYCIIDRTDRTPCKKMPGEAQSIKLTYGDMVVVPSQIVNAFLAVQLFRNRSKNNTIRTLRNAKKYVRRAAWRGYTNGTSNFSERKTGKTWHSIPIRDMQGIFEENPQIATNMGSRRVRHLQTFLKTSGFIRYSLPSYNGHTLSVLARPQDTHLFEDQLLPHFQQSVPQIELVMKQRARAVSLLEKIVYTYAPVIEQKEFDLNYDGPIKEKIKQNKTSANKLTLETIDASGLSKVEVEALHNLVDWKPAPKGWAKDLVLSNDN
ncbi:MAG: hypothetical protein ACMXYF_02755 [Candidatus Woesearchaeota archaeon]